MRNKNLITEDSWSERWSDLRRGPRPLRPWRSYQDWLYCSLFQKFVPQNGAILEVGCGGSRWLPYFARHFNADVWGLDFSSKGLETARDALRRARFTAKLVQADLFKDTQTPTAYFDVVWSAGFIEHFTETSTTLRTMARYVKSGGLVITSVPNGSGIIGRLRRWGEPDTNETHLTFTPTELDAVHEAVGLQIVQPAQWFGTFSLTMINAVRLRKRLPRLAYRLLFRVTEAFQAGVTLPLWLTRTRLESEAFSPYVMGVYRRC